MDREEKARNIKAYNEMQADRNTGGLNQATDTPTKPYNRLESIDASISYKEEEINSFKREVEFLQRKIENSERDLKELQKVRKVVTPQMESAIKALRQVGLV